MDEKHVRWARHPAQAPVTSAPRATELTASPDFAHLGVPGHTIQERELMIRRMFSPDTRSRSNARRSLQAMQQRRQDSVEAQVAVDAAAAHKETTNRE
jgi:hypothetical protein